MNFTALSLDRRLGAQLYLQLADRLATAIECDDAAVGERLPAERELAAQLGVSRTTVAAAYRELEARGLVRAHVGRGTYVCAEIEEAGIPFSWRGKLTPSAASAADPAMVDLLRWSSDPNLISFAAGAPALDRFPQETFNEISQLIMQRHGLAVLGHGPGEGQPLLRHAIARRHGVRAEQVLVLSGSQQGLDLIARCLLERGDVVLLDRPGYLGAIHAFRAAGATLVGWDAVRADVAELEDLILRHRPKLLYTTPTFQNPTGRTLGIGQRKDLLALAGRYRLPIVEDDPYRELYFAAPPPPALHDLDSHGTVIRLGTFSKSFAPGLRLGWLVAAPAIVEQLAVVKLRSDLNTPNLTQLVLEEFLSSGQFDRHVELLRGEHARRAALLTAGLTKHLAAGALRARRPAGGMYLWCRLPDGQCARSLLHAGIAAGVAFAPGELFYADVAGGDRLRLCFASVAAEQIEEGARRLGVAWAKLATAEPCLRAQVVPMV